MSAQETVFEQVSSNAILVRTITSKASSGRERLISASHSAELKGCGGDENGGITAIC